MFSNKRLTSKFRRILPELQKSRHVTKIVVPSALQGYVSFKKCMYRVCIRKKCSENFIDYFPSSRNGLVSVGSQKVFDTVVVHLVKHLFKNIIFVIKSPGY